MGLLFVKKIYYSQAKYAASFEIVYGKWIACKEVSFRVCILRVKNLKRASVALSSFKLPFHHSDKLDFHEPSYIYGGSEIGKDAFCKKK